MTRVLVTGASGMLGRSVMKELLANAKSWETLGLAFSRTGPGLKKCDLTDPKQIKTVFEEFKPNVVIHSAAERRPDVVDKNEEATTALNVGATEAICNIAEECGAYVIYISTDYVFDGNDAPYEVDATPNPLNRYGKTKFEGEKMVLKINKGNIVLRVPILYGEVGYIEESAVTIIIKQIFDKTKEHVSDDYARRFPTYTGDIAAVLRELIEKRTEDDSIKGIYHWSGDENMTKYSMGQVMSEVFSLPFSHVKPNKNAPTDGVPRPYDANLSSKRIESLGICKRTPFRDGIKICLDQFVPKS